jgi:hypothetical protein
LSVTFSPTGTGTVTINPATLGTINNMTIGATTAAAGTFTNLTATGTVGGAGFTTLLTPYALVNSQVFTGTPSLPTGTIGVTQAAATNNTTLATTAYVKSQNYLTANQSIALTGDVTGSGTTSIASTVVQLQGRPLSASLPASGNLMGWNGTTWGPVAAGAAAAGGTANQIQYNNGGVLGGLPTTGTFASSNVVMSIAPTLTNSLNITGAASNDSTLVMNKSASLQQCRINAQMGGVSRWQMMLGDTTAEGGSNAGSDFTLSRFTDAGGALDSPLKIIRSTGVATFTQALFSANHTITGAAGNNAAVIVNKAAAGFYSGIDGQTAGSRRWLMMLGNATAEGGSNAGSDFMINRYTDAAGFIDTPLTITRSSGDATFSAGLYVLNSAVTAKQIVINGAALGSVAGNIQTVFAAGSTTTNGEQLRSEVQRKSAGSDWTTAAWQTYRVVDGTKMGYVEYGSQAVKPIAFGVATTELASISSTGVFTAASTLVGTGAVLNAPAATDSVLWLNKPASGRANAVYGQMAASNRWALTLGDTTAESGSNLGSNYVLSTFTDAGAFLGNPLVVSRASGYAYFNANGATSALSYDAAPYGHSAIRVNKAGSGKTSQIAGLNNGLVRWVVDMGNGNTETGTGNTGSDFVISRCNDAGAGLDSPLQILRSTGVVTFVRPITIQNFDNLGHLRLVGGNYGATIRNDGSACYLLQTASGDQYGAFNSARPFSWNLSSGAVNIDGGAAGTTFGGPITTTGQIFTSGNVIGGSLYASNGQITTYAAAANGFYNLCDGAGNNGQVCTMTFRGLGSGFSAQVNLAQITFAAVAATANGTLDVLGGENGRQGPYGTQGQVNTAFWNGANLEWRIGGTFVGYVQFISDYRVKQNVAALPSMWDRIKALNPISYELQDYTPPEGARNIAGGRDNPKQLIVADGKERWGFVAHELQEALTEDAATGVKDAPDMLQAPNPWTVIAALTKALQEAMARIEALEARA